jgi:hypothetical protein
MRENQFKLWPSPTVSAAPTSPYRKEPPAAPAPSRLERVREGASALVLVARTVWGDLALRRFYLRVATLQALATLALGLLAVSLFIDADDDEPRKHEGKRPKNVIITTEGAKKRDQSIVIKNDKHTVIIGPDGIDVRPADSSVAAAPSGAPSAGSAPPGGAADEDDDKDDGDDEGERAGAGVAPRPKVVVHAEVGEDDEGDEGEPAAGREGRKSRLKAFWGKVVAIYGIFVGAGWCVVALSRDYHDAIGREASLRLELPPEDPPVSPRVRLNVGWVKTRIKRRLRGFLLFTLGAPPLWALSFFVVLPLVGINYLWDVFDTSAVISRLYGLLAAAWGGYWLMVFTTAKTQLAWADERDAPEPWFLRLWGGLIRRLPAAFAWLPRGYGQAWRSMSRSVFSPASCYERAPYELGGLAALRLLGSVPGLYPFVRPLVPVAAAMLVKRHCPPPAPAAGDARPPGSPGVPGMPGMRAPSLLLPPR